MSAHLPSCLPSFPSMRARRLRQSPSIRSLARETELLAHDLIMPLFVHDAEESTPIDAMPGQRRLNFLDLVKEAKLLASLGIQSVALFAVVPSSKKSEDAKEAYNANSLAARSIKMIKEHAPSLCVIADCALDPYTLSGHDGFMDEQGRIKNDATLEILSKQALMLANAGADVVAPSDMMDGRIMHLRRALEEAGHSDVLLLSYAAKYASAFYGPFRDALGSDAQLGKKSKKTYQMDPANTKEAIKEALLDQSEGADVLMVKPAMVYLDIIHQIKSVSLLPVFAYQVSGEYSMIKLAAMQGIFDEKSAALESLVAIKRAGASKILSYFAKDAALWLQHAKN